MNGSPGGESADHSVKMEPTDVEYSLLSGSSVGPPSTWPNGIKPISSEQEELIRSLVFFQNEFEHPTQEEIGKIKSDVIIIIFFFLIKYCN